MFAPAFVTSGASVLTNGLSRACNKTATASTTPRRAQHRFHMSASRKFFVAGNWKCNLDKSSIADLVKSLNDGPPLDHSMVEVLVAPPSVYVESTRTMLRSDFSVGAQNSWIAKGGAFTGEIDATMIKDVGGDWVILGHSERRHSPVINETDEAIAQKAAYATKEAGIKVMYCIGELLEERESGKTVAVCENQMAYLASAITDWSNIVIAYEPVWAIGTGKVASPEQAEEVHFAMRAWLEKNVSKQVADTTRIVYGGSVSPANCQDLAKKPNIDGLLVGGASLKPSFLEIVASYKAALAGAV